MIWFMCRLDDQRKKQQQRSVFCFVMLNLMRYLVAALHCLHCITLFYIAFALRCSNHRLIHTVLTIA